MDSRFTILNPRRRRGSRPAGFTLVEMAIVLAFSAIMLVAFYAFVATQTMASYEESSEISVQTDIRTTMSQLVQELEGAHLFSLDSNANWVCYQIPQTGPSGTFILDSSGNVQYGAMPFDTSIGWQAGGYYQITFVDSTDARDVLLESALINPGNPTGQNISGTYKQGATNFTVGFDKAFIFGHFEVQCHGAPTTNGAGGPNGALLGPVRVLEGKCLRQYDPTDVSTPKRTYPWGGGFFYLRNTLAQPTLNAAGTAAGTSWSPQTADTFTDTNGNGVYDAGEPYNDINGSGDFQEADCEPFNDLDGNNVKNGVESFTDTNGNGVWDAKLRIQVRSFDRYKTAPNSGDQRNSAAVVRLLTTRVKIRNN